MQIEFGGITADVVCKNIKNVHLSVHPPAGRVRIAAPLRMNLNTVRIFAISKLNWIKRQQQTLLKQEREPPREYLERESHYLWGTRYLLKVVEAEASPKIELKHRTLLLQVRPGTNHEKRQAAVDAWYRRQLRDAVPPLIAKWEPLIGVRINGVTIRRMKTKWGSCSPRAGSVRLNTELAKKPWECLEYIIVHEMTHLLEPTHNRHFLTLMDRFMPGWQVCRETLNRLPVRNEHWCY